jgi:hypothetical protein
MYYFLTPIKELRNLIKYKEFKSIRKIEYLKDILNVNEEIYDIYVKNRKKNEYCLIRSEYDLLNQHKIKKFDKILIDTIYFVIKNEDKENNELIEFKYNDINKEYINIILQYKN